MVEDIAKIDLQEHKMPTRRLSKYSALPFNAPVNLSTMPDFKASFNTKYNRYKNNQSKIRRYQLEQMHEEFGDGFDEHLQNKFKKIDNEISGRSSRNNSSMRMEKQYFDVTKHTHYDEKIFDPKLSTLQYERRKIHESIDIAANQKEAALIESKQMRGSSNKSHASRRSSNVIPSGIVIDKSKLKNPLATTLLISIEEKNMA